MENNRNHNRKTGNRSSARSTRSQYNKETPRNRGERNGEKSRFSAPQNRGSNRKTTTRGRAQAAHTAANNRQKAAVTARRKRNAERKALKLKKQSLVRIGLFVILAVVLSLVIWQIAAAVKVNMEISKNVTTLAKIESQDPSEFLSAKTPGGINVKDFAAEESKIVNMDTSSVENADLLRQFRGTVIIGDSLTKGCTNYGYLNESIVIAQAAIPLRESDHLFEKAIQSAPAALFICLGANDIGYYGQNVDEFIAEYTKRIQNVQKELPNTFIYVQGILPVADRITGSNQKYLSLYDEEMQKMCDDLGVYFFTSGFILKQMPQLYDQDGIHPKRDFYPRWLTYMADIAGLKS